MYFIKWICRLGATQFLRKPKRFVLLSIVLVLLCLHVLPKTVNTIVYIKDAVTPLCHVREGYGQEGTLSCPITFKSQEPVIVTFATNAWYSLVENWLCSLKRQNISATAVIVGLDKELCPKLKMVLFDRNVICFEPLKYSMYKDIGKEMPSAKSWGTPKYQRIIKFRTQVIYSILLCNRFVLLSDVDVVFLRNPVPHLQQLIGGPILNKQETSAQFDMIFQRGFMDLQLLDYFENWTIFGKWYVCAGFVFMAPTNNTLNFWSTIMKYQETDWNDQAGINKCLILSKNKVRWTVLPSSLYQNGFKLRKKKTDLKLKHLLRSDTRYNSGSAPRLPYMLHFNWIAGTSKKKAAMKRYNVWCVNQ